MLQDKLIEQVKKLEGPIAIFGAGGFIGANLMRLIITHRDDVYAITSKPFIPWRLDDIEEKKVLHCDITYPDKVAALFESYGFKTVFNFAAYGAYSKQDDLYRIYKTNFMGLLHILEAASKYNIKAVIHSGSSSEYGLNSDGPKEHDPTTPNSHYAVSKSSAAELIKYYGTLKGINVCNLRYYSVYGPYEEPDRLIPVIIGKGMAGEYPPLVEPEISRDFIYIDDVMLATLLSANLASSIKGRSINIASGKKTTIREVAFLSKEIFGISSDPSWGNMANRNWDLKDWFGDPALAKELLKWESITDLKTGLVKTADWQKSYSKPLYEKKIYQDKIRHKLSAVIACYKDGQAIPIMYQRLSDTFKKLNVDYEIIFVNDCSPDNSSEVIQQIADRDEHVIGIEHSRNFGSQSAFLSGMQIATGDGVILLDGDLQDPPELIEQFYERYCQGFDVIYGRRVAREGNQVLVRFYKLFYRLFRSVSYVPMPLDAGDFSLMDRKVVDELVKLPETDQFLRGLRAWVGFRQTGVDYVRPERMFGVTTNNMRKNIAWARKAIFSFSYVPLEFLTYLGSILTLVSFIALAMQVILYFMGANIPHGITTIICLILLFGGLQMLGIAILGEYQSKILEEAKRRPKFIRKKIIQKNQQ